MGKLSSALVYLVVGGLAVALLRQFDWDPFAAADWALSWVWDAINRVADLWSDNETFQKATEKPE